MVNIAIDGPAGAGKSTLSRMLAEKLGFIYVDTGALYRAVGLYAVRNNIVKENAAELVKALGGVKIDLQCGENGQKVIMDGEDVTGLIRTPQISMAASWVSAVPEVRSFLLGLQKNIAANNNIIMDGRDIGTVVLPDAKLKIFLKADPRDRAKRRYEELLQKGQKVSFDDVLEDMVKRDEQDSCRAAAPLKPADDAVVVDTTGYEIEKSFGVLYKICTDAVKRLN